MSEAYAYVRVSTSDEHVENQVLAIEAYAKQRGIRIVEFFEDVGVSGAVKPEERPGFRRLLEAVRREPRPVLVYEVSRIGRASFYEILRVIKMFEDLGAPIIPVSPKEAFLQNLDRSIRDLVLAILAWAAERERELLRQRTREGMMRAKLQGKHVGRPRKLTERDLPKIREYRAKGLSWADIARLMGVGYSTIRRYARRWSLK